VIRERYGLEEGDYLVLEPRDEDLVVRKGRMVTSDEDFEALAAHVVQRFEDRGSRARTSKTPFGGSGRSGSLRHQRPGEALAVHEPGTKLRRYSRALSGNSP
jgi:hypothetical protein